MLRRFVHAAAVALVICSCTSKDDSAGAEGQAAAAEEKAGVETITIPSRAPATLDVSDAGAEPRVQLRLRPTVGATERLELAIGMRMKMENGAQGATEVPVPTTKTVMKSAIESVSAEGIEVTMSVDDVKVEAAPGTPPAVLEKVRETTEPLKQYTAKMTMSDRGHVLGGSVELPRDLPAMVHNTMRQMTESLGQIAVPLPEPALGVGAKWTATYDLEQNGMKMRQLASYTLTAYEGDLATLDVSISQELLDPEVKVPGMIGTKARVGEFSSMGRGTAVIDLGRASPHSMQMTLDMSMAMDVTVLGQNQHVAMEMGIDMQMTAL